MIKLLQKKEISTEESPIMLQRRHTVMDVDKGCVLAEPKPKSVNRSNSISSLNQTKNKHLEKAGHAALSPKGSISTSNASTVVITDCELSSSWLYTNKKAQIKTSEAVSPRSSSSRLDEVKDEMKSPMLPMSRTRSDSKAGERTKKSSCCCYSLIILIISVATLGILAAIASILYMEFFASFNITDIHRTTASSQDSVPLKKVGHSVSDGNQMISNPEKLPGRASESVLFSQSPTKDTKKGISTEKQSQDEDSLAIDEKKNGVQVNGTADSSSVIIDDLLNLTSQMINSIISDPKEISNPISSLFSSNQNLESHYNKLFELYQGLRPTGSGIEIASDETSEHEQDSSIVDATVAKDSPAILKDNENIFGVSDIARDSSVLDDKPKDLSVVAEDSFHLDNTVEENNMKDSLNLPHENPSKQLEFTPKGTVEFNQEIDESEKMESFPHEPIHPMPEENLKHPNSFRNLDIDFEKKIPEEQLTVSDPDPPLSNLPISGSTNASNFIPKFLSQLDRTWGISTLFRNLDGDSQNVVPKDQTSDETDSVDLNLPILQTNIAVPRPIEMTRRSGKEDNEKNDLSGDLTEHDRRFSLAKALDRLRLLDANDILPSSRQSKTESPKNKDDPKMQTDQEVATEQSHYLETLRKKFFEQ